MDVVGFKELIRSQPLDTVLKRFEQLPEFGPVFNALGKIQVDNNTFKPDTRFTSVHQFGFSDSIVLASKDDSLDSLNSIIVTTFLWAQFFFVNRLPLRGAIAVGESGFITGTQHLMGKGLLAAYDLEQAQEWYGIMLADDLGYSIPEQLHPGVKPLVVHYTIPWKDKESAPLGKLGYALNWRFNIWSEEGIEALLPAPRTDSPSDKDKRDNTLAFLMFLNQTDRRAQLANEVNPELSWLKLVKIPKEPLVSDTIRLWHGDRF